MEHDINKSEDTQIIENFHTEGGHCFKELRLRYTTYGVLNETRDNVVWFLHPLTATSDPLKWWSGIVGAGHVFDPQRYFVICVNNPGSPYGSSSPLDIDPASNEPYFHEFPRLSMRDLVKAFDLLRQQLGIEKIRIACGASMGGQLLYQWLVSFPRAIRTAVIVAASPCVSAWMLASNFLQKQCIYSDPTWQEKRQDAGKLGMKQARQVAFLSFRSPIIFQLFQNVNMRLSNVADEEGFVEPVKETNTRKIVSEYLDYQGEKFLERFNIFSYLRLLEMMDSHDIQGLHNSMEDALQTIEADVLKIGVDSDLLFYPTEVKAVIPHINKIQYREISSVYGHDAFLVESKQIEDIIVEYLHQIDEYYLH